MRLEHALDLRGADAALEAFDDLFALYERERRDGADVEPLGELRLLVHVDRRDAEACAVLAREGSDQALHPAARARVGGAEEDEQGAGVVRHRKDITPANPHDNPLRESLM